jgi:putative endonuclease
VTRVTAKGAERRAAERKGRVAEGLAALAYLIRGYEILDRRFRASGGEADLIVRRGRLIAFVEVKSRKDDEAAILAVTPKNRRRLEQAAARYLALRPYFGEFAVRYDIAAVAGFRVTVVRDAWRARA